MAASNAARIVGSGSLRGAQHGWQRIAEAVPVAQKLTQQFEKLLQDSERADEERREMKAADPRQAMTKSFPFHLGADLNVPTSQLKMRSAEALPAEAQATKNPFAGLPLQEWAERLGDRVMPAYELIKEEQRKAKAAAKPAVAAATVPASFPVPHLLPFTRWAANSETMRETFIAADPKLRKRARLSWYHPDDTMVPRDWFRGGLMEDLKYYSPFRLFQ